MGNSGSREVDYESGSESEDEAAKVVRRSQLSYVYRARGQLSLQVHPTTQGAEAVSNPVHAWSVQQVAEWLLQLGYDQASATANDAVLDGKTLIAYRAAFPRCYIHALSAARRWESLHRTPCAIPLGCRGGHAIRVGVVPPGSQARREGGEAAGGTSAVWCANHARAQVSA